MFRDRRLGQLERRGWWKIEVGPWTGKTEIKFFWDRESRIMQMCERIKRGNPHLMVLPLFMGRDRRDCIPPPIKGYKAKHMVCKEELWGSEG